MAASIENNPLGEEVGLNMRDPEIRLVQHMSPARTLKWTALNGHYPSLCIYIPRHPSWSDNKVVCYIEYDFHCTILRSSQTQTHEDHHDMNI
jgi:hypothetical protein